jgi:hypothetical protein
MSERLYREGAKQGTQAPSPAPRLIPAETENQLRTNIAIGTANGGHFKDNILHLSCPGHLERYFRLPDSNTSFFRRGWRTTR